VHVPGAGRAPCAKRSSMENANCTADYQRAEDGGRPRSHRSSTARTLAASRYSRSGKPGPGRGAS
jgi:hypothetical protein